MEPMELFSLLIRTWGMGEIRTPVRLENMRDAVLSEEDRLPLGSIRSIELDAVVDTGAVLTLLPRDAAESLGLPSMGEVTVTLADESKVRLEKAGPVRLTVAGRTMFTDCLIGPPGCEPLLGQIVLEELDLICDPARRRVTPRPESPDTPNLKLKHARQGIRMRIPCRAPVLPPFTYTCR